jgi:hypothetical protein
MTVLEANNKAKDAVIHALLAEIDPTKLQSIVVIISNIEAIAGDNLVAFNGCAVFSTLCPELLRALLTMALEESTRQVPKVEDPSVSIN